MQTGFSMNTLDSFFQFRRTASLGAIIGILALTMVGVTRAEGKKNKRTRRKAICIWQLPNTKPPKRR